MTQQEDISHFEECEYIRKLKICQINRSNVSNDASQQSHQTQMDFQFEQSGFTRKPFTLRRYSEHFSVALREKCFELFSEDKCDSVATIF